MRNYVSYFPLPNHRKSTWFFNIYLIYLSTYANTLRSLFANNTIIPAAKSRVGGTLARDVSLSEIHSDSPEAE